METRTAKARDRQISMASRAGQKGQHGSDVWV
jgi:hypothetical protein